MEKENKEQMTQIEKLIKIDGGYLEGGGQTIRISLCLSAILRKDIEVSKIRSGRSNPGLQKQHLYSALAIIDIFSQIGEGISLNSQTIIVKNKVCENDSIIEIKNNPNINVDGAGSIGLVIQELLPSLILCKNEKVYNAKITGGTIVNFAPSTFYLSDVLFKFLELVYKISCTLKVNRHGFYPVGQGNVDLSIETNEKMNHFKPLNLNSRGKLKNIIVRSIYTNKIEKNEVEKIHKSVLKEVEKMTRSYEEMCNKLTESINDISLNKHSIVNNDKNNIQNKNNEKCISNDIEQEEDQEEDIDKELDKIYKKDKNNLMNSDEKSNCVKIEDSIFVFHDKKSFTHVVEIIAYFEHTIVYHELKYSEKKSSNDENMTKLKRDLISEFEETLNREDKLIDEYTMDHLIIFMALIPKNETSSIITNMLSNHTLTALYVIKLISGMSYKIEIKSYEIESTEESKFKDITDLIIDLPSDELTKYIENLNKNNTTFKLTVNGILNLL